ncbi:MAG: ABC transporter substrate-binding protein [Cytophagaceae bacterium]|nr:ABC transporter substrate-binding protein [Cytophagaceae bacterium]
MKITVKIGGVPEHFNYPWHKAIEEGKFIQHGIDVQWSDYPGGTGALVQDLADKKLDMAVLLTEGAVAAASKGSPFRLLHYTVKSPLVWGIHTGAQSSLQTISDIPGKTFAISRFGSGSHLMAIVQALLNDWPLDHMSWVEVKNLAGAKEALVANEADVFLWERFMTKPLVDEGALRLLGLLPTPWSSFVLVVREDFLAEQRETVKQISSELLAVQKQVKEEKELPKILADRYGLQREDVLTWLDQTVWEYENELPEKEIEEVSECLLRAGVLEKLIQASKLLA